MSRDINEENAGDDYSKSYNIYNKIGGPYQG
jgi:hypothetical protein